MMILYLFFLLNVKIRHSLFCIWFRYVSSREQILEKNYRVILNVMTISFFVSYENSFNEISRRESFLEIFNVLKLSICQETALIKSFPCQNTGTSS